MRGRERVRNSQRATEGEGKERETFFLSLLFPNLLRLNKCNFVMSIKQLELERGTEKTERDEKERERHRERQRETDVSWSSIAQFTSHWCCSIS